MQSRLAPDNSSGSCKTEQESRAADARAQTEAATSVGMLKLVSEATNQEHRRCTALADGNDARLREALPLHAEDYVARHREKGCLPFTAHRLYEMLPEAEGSALIESLDYTQVLPGHHGSYPNILRSVCFLVLVCVGTQFVPSVATRVVADVCSMVL